MTSLRERLLEQARQRAQEPASPALENLRATAFELLAARELPTQRDEDWRFTPLRALENLPFEPAARRASPPAPPAGEVGDGIAFCFADGFACSRPAAPPGGVALRSLAEELEQRPEPTCKCLGSIACDKERVFTALNTSCFQDGAWLSIPEGTALEPTVHLLFWQAPDAAPRASHPRCWIELGAGSRARVVEHHFGAGGFGNAVTEIALGRDARLEHVLLQHAGPRAVHLSQIAVRQEAGSTFASHSLALGAALSRVEIATALQGEGAHASLHGLYLGRGDQLVDHHTQIDHATPHTTSEELYKGILDGRAHGVFHGRIRVRPDAQRIDAQQQNRTLLLADGPIIHAKPQLEIYADDVRCSHGATVGRLDEQALFYLRSRGLSEAEARGLLTVAFARQVTQGLPVPELAERLERELPRWLAGSDMELGSGA